ncbi:hypothetical protein [Streptomyces sp. NPDC050759]|uniref:hypothetical protein n=1 Tax=Streptomyces sp. NPDC050759 TaxID=3365635 RepID=UPI00378CEA60
MSNVLTAPSLCPSGTVALISRDDLRGIRLMSRHEPMPAADHEEATGASPLIVDTDCHAAMVGVMDLWS